MRLKLTTKTAERLHKGDFNSTVVRLKHDVNGIPRIQSKYFNSTVVRLKLSERIRAG